MSDAANVAATFDRQAVVDSPDLEGRDAILKLHARDKPLAPEANLHQIAQETRSFSGADLANVLNETALLAARHNGLTISQKDLEDAVEKAVAGPEHKSRRLTKEDKRRVAYHEVGHALVAAYSKHAEQVRKISIVPRGHATLGYTLQLPGTDHYLMDHAELVDNIKGLLGGRASEDIVFAYTQVPSDTTLQKLVDQEVLAHGRQCFLVSRGESVVGLITLHNLKEIPRASWMSTTAAQAMTPLDKLSKLDPNAELWTAMEKMSRDGINLMPVMLGNNFVGMLSTGDIVKYLHTLQQVTT